MKNPFLETCFVQTGVAAAVGINSRITAVQLSNDIGLGASIRVDVGALADGRIWQDTGGGPTPTAIKALAPVSVTAKTGNAKFTISVPDPKTTAGVQQQATIVIARATWDPECEIAHMLALGTFFPISQTDDAGMTYVGGRMLPWSPTAAANPPAKTIDFFYSPAGVLSWSHLGITASLNLSVGVVGSGLPGAKGAQLIVLTRNSDTASLAASAFGNSTVLQLG